MTQKRHKNDISMTYIFLFVLILTPRIYLLDLTSTPAEQRENFVTTSTDLIVPLDEDWVFVSELIEG